MRLVHRSYDGKDGVKRHVTEIVLSDLKVITYAKAGTEDRKVAA